MQNMIGTIACESCQKFIEPVSELTNLISWNSIIKSYLSRDSTTKYSSPFVSDTRAVSPIIGYVLITVTVFILTSVITTILL